MPIHTAATMGSIFALCALFASSCWAGCSDDKVKRLSSQGRTVVQIAKQCDMEKDDVKTILEGDDPDPDPDPGPAPDNRHGRGGLPPGTPLGACGCWGPMSPGYQEPKPQCSSGYARAQACNQMCMGGGYAWHGVCG